MIRSVLSVIQSDMHRTKATPYKFSHPAFLWLAVCLVLITAVWVYAESRLASERNNIRQKAFSQLENLADSYAEQLHRTVEQIDQLTLLLKYNWEQSYTVLDLESLRNKGLFPNNLLMHASVIGIDGNIVSTSMGTEKEINLSDAEYFQYHRHNNHDGLRISAPSPGARTGRMLIRFTRRINNVDGSFGGVAAVVVQPSYLLSFPKKSSLGQGDFISVRFVSGTVLATQVGGGENTIFYREDPKFPSVKGSSFEPASQFRDDQNRFVSWHVNEKYPLVALAAITEDGVFSGYHQAAENLRTGAIAGSLAIACLAFFGMLTSIRLARQRQRAEEARSTLRLATDAANEGFFAIRPVYDKDGTVRDFIYEDCNERGANMLGYTRTAILGNKLSNIMPANYLGDILSVFERAMNAGFLEDEIRIPKNSPLRASWVYRRMVRSGSTLAVTLRDISKPKEHEQALSKLANTDALTTLPNRYWLTSFLPSAIEQARAGKYSLAILFIDLDNFKNINDSLGHDAGDELLVAAAARLKSVVRASDDVVRLGGDEFTVILKHIPGIDDIAQIAQMIVNTIGEPFSLKAGAGQRVNASIGISVFPQDGEDGEALLKHADIAMYAAKAAGKGRFYFYQTHFSDTLLLKLNKEHALREAVEIDQFIIHYQPRIRVDTGSLSSIEALVRWQHPERGLVYPSEFIQMAEDNGLIIRIGELVIEKVCAQIAQWQRQNVFLVPISINVSGLQLKEGNVSGFLAGCLLRYGVSPNLVEVELTESSVIEKSIVVSKELQQLRALGIRLLIDDFGTGYSSLAQLHQLDVDVLKVDHVFTAELSKENGTEVLFRAILSMASELEIRVVAEGVETTDQLRTLMKLSCYEAQGNLISRAVSASEMQEMLLKRVLFPIVSLYGPSTI
jgi:diguanylate cyclase (GGDEF)-like protein